MIQNIRLGALVIDARPGFACGQYDDNGVVQVRMNNIGTDGSLIWDKIRRVPPPKNLPALLLRANDILFNATNSPELVGKTALFKLQEEDVTYSNHFIRLRLNESVASPAYVCRVLQNRWQERVFAGMCKQWVNQASVSKDDLFALEIPMPPLEQQTRIGAILDQVDNLRRLRQRTIERVSALGFAIFRDLFGDTASNSHRWNDQQTLGEVAEIVSGITKGRRVNGQRTRVVPYLAVANVQDRELRLSQVKTIEATNDEIQRYRLELNDLLLTEGGDPDKLGRGTLWNGELPDCIHQNHVFRVRLTSRSIEPVFLSWLIGSERGKRYFLRSAKQTTGIASINMTQLKSFPLLIPPISVQKVFCQHIAMLEQHQKLYRKGYARMQSLFGALQHRAFRGELQ